MWSLGITIVELALGFYPLPAPTHHDIHCLFDTDGGGDELLSEAMRARRDGRAAALSAFEILACITDKSAPAISLPHTHFSDNVRQFIDVALRRDPSERVDLDGLRRCAFVNQYEADHAYFYWLRRLVDKNIIATA